MDIRRGGSARRPPGPGSDSGTVPVSMITTTTDALLDGETRGDGRALVENLLAKYEPRFFASLERISSTRTTTNFFSALAVGLSISQMLFTVTSGRLAEAFEVDTPFSVVLGFFESSFPVYRAVFVIVLIALAVPWTITFVAESSGALLAGKFRWLVLTFLNVGYLPCFFILLRIPSRCMPWRDTATRNAVGRLLIGDYEADGVVCNSPQSMLMMGVGIVCAVGVLATAGLLMGLYHDPYPTSRSIMARSHSRVAVAELVFKIMLGSAVLFTGSTAGDIFVMAFCIIGAICLLVLHYLYLPHFHAGVNIAWACGVGFLAFSTLFFPAIYFEPVEQTTVLRGLLATVFALLGVSSGLVARRRLRRLQRDHGLPEATAQLDADFPDASGDASSSMSNASLQGAINVPAVKPFARATDVEISTRQLIKAGDMAAARRVYTRGLDQFPESRLLALQYATFLAVTGAYTEADVALDVLDTMLQGSGLLAVDLRYGSFALRKEIARRRRAEGVMDVASYIKYNARLVEAKRAHTAAMRHVHSLWSLVLRSDEEFLRRSHRLAESIDKQSERASKLFAALLEDYPNGTPILRAYAAFVEEVHHDEVLADKLYMRADFLEGRRHGGRGGGGGGGGGGPMARDGDGARLESNRMIPNEATDAVLTVTGDGRILSANHNVRLFGTSIDEAVGRNVMSLVRLGGTSILAVMEGYADGVKTSEVEVVDGVHTSGNIVRLVADLTPVSAGARPKFALVLRPIRRGAAVRITADGTVVAVSGGVRRLLGWKASALVGKSVEEFLPGLVAAIRAGGTVMDNSVSTFEGPSDSGEDGSLIGDEAAFVSIRRFATKHKTGANLSFEVVATVERHGGAREVATRLVVLTPSSNVCSLIVGRNGRISGSDGSVRTVLFRPRRLLVGEMVDSILCGLTPANLAKQANEGANGANDRVYTVVAADGSRQLCAVSVVRLDRAGHIGASPSRGTSPGPSSAADGSVRNVERGGSRARRASIESVAVVAYEVSVRLVASDTSFGAGALSSAGLSTGGRLSSGRGSRLDNSFSGVSLASGGRSSRGGGGSDMGGVVGGRVRKTHRFRAKAFRLYERAGYVVEAVVLLSVFALFFYAINSRASLEQTPVRLALHTVRNKYSVLQMVDMRSTDIARRLSMASNDSALTASVSLVEVSHSHIDVVAEATALILSGNGSVWSIFDMGHGMPSFWTDGPRVDLVLATDPCSTATHRRNVTMNAAANLVIKNLLEGLTITEHQSHECAAAGALPSPLYFLMRNSLDGLLEVARAAINREAATGTLNIQTTRTTAIYVGAILAAVVAVVALLWCFALPGIRSERERAALAFVNIPKTEVAAILRHTGRYASARRKGKRRRRKSRLRGGRDGSDDDDDDGDSDNSWSNSAASSDDGSSGQGVAGGGFKESLVASVPRTQPRRRMSESGLRVPTSREVQVSIAEGGVTPTPAPLSPHRVGGAPARGGVLKPTSRTDYEPPQNARQAWEEPAANVQTSRSTTNGVNSYRRSLMRDLAPRLWPTVALFVMVILLAGFGILHFADTFDREDKLDDYLNAVLRADNAEQLLWVTREMWLAQAVGLDAFNVFDDAGVVAVDLIRKLLTDFEAAHEALEARPPSLEEELLRTECLVTQTQAGDWIVGHDDVADDSAEHDGHRLRDASADQSAVDDGDVHGVSTDGHCVTIAFVLQAFLHDIIAMVEAIEGSDATAEDLSVQMERIWELGNKVVVPTLDRSLEAYRADAADYSDGLQSVFLFLQLGVFGLLTLVLGLRWTAALKRDGERMVRLLRIIPHRVPETSMEMEEYLRGFE